MSTKAGRGVGESIMKNRFMGFLIWQSIQSTAIFILSKLFLFSPFTPSPKFTPSLSSSFFFLSFLFSLLLFSISLFLISSPQQLDRPVSPIELSFGLIRFLFISGYHPTSPEFCRRVMVLMGFVLFVVTAAFSGFLGLGCICWSCDCFASGFLDLGFKGFAAGLFYGLVYVYKKRLVLEFPIIQVLHTKRFMFAPPKGSAAAETNPSEPLLAALGESKAKSLLQYLAYLDLCMVCESNADTWRRAAFFEESGETYKRILAVCLRPLEQFTLKLGEGFESCSNEAFQLSHQLTLPTDRVAESKLQQAFYDIQLCAWCS